MNTPSSIQALEADVEARRMRLATDVDELAGRLTPQALAQQGKDSARAKLVAATRTPEGDLRTARIATVVATTVVTLVVIVLLRRRSR